MSELLEIIQDMQDTQAAIASATTTAALYPNKGSLLLNVNSLKKRLATLEDRFAILTAK